MLNFAFCRRAVLALIASEVYLSGIAIFSQQQQTQPTDQQPSSQSQAQTEAQQEVHKTRPRIGLTLEGGGALGFAHIGVIEWLEAHHIPVDYVSGTSMGGLVGGLYASGYGPEEIKAFVAKIDWTAVLSGQVPFQALSYRRKEDKLAFPNRLEFGLKNGFNLPSGLNSGTAVGLLFDRTMLPYYDLKSFDDLPIPFRCVATNIVTGQKHVFKDGSLAQALRSTMSIPGVFAPVQHGNDIYSDGGAVDNLPVDEARAMGANVVIASYLNSGPPEPGSLTSLVGIAGRNVSIMVSANEVQSLKDANIVISSDVSKYGTMEFSRSDVIIPLGEKAAAEQSAELEKYSLNDADWAEYLRQRQARRRTKVPVPQFVDVYGLTGSDQQDVDARFEKYVDKPVDPDAIENTIADLQGTGLYSSISYNIEERDGKPGLLIRPRTKSWGPPFMNFGLTILADQANNVQLGLQARATFYNLVGPGSEVRLDGSIGALAALRGELYKPIVTGSHFFVAPHGYITHQLIPYYEGTTQLDQYTEKRNGLGVDLAYQFDAKAELRIGEDYQWYSQNLKIGTPALTEFSLTPLVTNAQFQYFGQDDYMVPTRGSIVATYFNYYTKRPNTSGGYSQLQGTLEHFIPIKSRGILTGAFQGGTSFNASNLGLAGFTLGGPLRLNAYSRDELLGTDYFLGQVGYLYRLIKLNPVIADAIYAGGIYEIGKMYGGNSQTPSLPNDVAGFVVIKTLIGPIFGGVSIGDSDHRKWFFGLGRVF
jgi:NTE family protein